MKDILIGPFRQILTMRHLPMKGAIKNENIEIISEGAILVSNGKIKTIGKYDALKNQKSIEAKVKECVHFITLC